MFYQGSERHSDIKRPMSMSVSLVNNMYQSRHRGVRVYINSRQEKEEDRSEYTNSLPTIFRVPPKIRSADEAAYAPMTVSIGAFNNTVRDGKLRRKQDEKQTCMEIFMKTSKDNSLHRVCLVALKKLEWRIRNSYSGGIKMDKDELTEMMLVDGCFILRHLLQHSEGAKTSKTENIDEIDRQVIHDLLLLENQIPFFVIVHLFSVISSNYGPCSHDETGKLLVACSLRLFKNIHPHGVDDSFSVNYDQVHHLLHLFYLSISSQCTHGTSSPSSKQLETSPRAIPSAKELHEAGAKFKMSTTDASCSFLDIKFSNGVMGIPPLQVDDYSNSLFRNLIAFEHCYPNTGFHVTIYASFMGRLLNTPEDARLLNPSGILTNRMTTGKDAAHFFRPLCDQVHYPSDSSYLRDLCVDVNKYHRQYSRRHKWRAVLVRNHFSSQYWLIISFVFAIFLVLLTSGQNFFTIYPSYHK